MNKEEIINFLKKEIKLNKNMVKTLDNSLKYKFEDKKLQKWHIEATKKQIEISKNMVKYYKEIINYIEEKDKIIEEKNKFLLEIAKEEINFINYLKSKGMNFDNESWIKELEEILERGKNGK